MVGWMLEYTLVDKLGHEENVTPSVMGFLDCHLMGTLLICWFLLEFC